MELAEYKKKVKAKTNEALREINDLRISFCMEINKFDMSKKDREELTQSLEEYIKLKETLIRRLS